MNRRGGVSRESLYSENWTFPSKTASLQSCGRLTMPTTSIVDLTEVRYIDSTALGCLVRVKNDLIQRGGGKVQLVGLQPNVRRVFALTKLDEIFEISE